MRRSLAAFAASAALLLSMVGSATGGQPGGPAGLAPVIEPSPSVEPSPSLEPQPSGAAQPSGDPQPSASAEPAPTLQPLPPTEPAPSADPQSSAEPVVQASTPPAAPPEVKAPVARDPRSATDPTNRWIVVLKAGTDATAAADRQGRRMGFKTDRTYRSAVRGYAATLDRAQVNALRGDASVAMIVADERIEAMAQTMPTGISRVGANLSSVARVDGLDERVDGDVAIVDTGISPVADLNVAGGYNCSTADPTAWRDLNGHGTHVAGTIGALDNGLGVVGVAPGVRVWAVKILDDGGEGLLSWYVCGLDWIAAQRDPSNASRPLFESVNMSVAKWGSDDVNCGLSNADILHQAICRLVASGVTVVAAAGNDSGSAAARVPAAYNEVITVSALADTDGKPGGLGGNRCYSWGAYDRDDTFADFSNRGSDVDLIAPGKCIWSTIPGGYAYMSGTSMAAPHVSAAVALLKESRPGLTPAEVKEALQYLGNLGWATSTDPDPYHERLLDVSRIGPRGDFSVAAGPEAVVGRSGGTARIAVTVTRSATSFERITLAAGGLPAGVSAGFAPASLYGFGTAVTTASIAVPAGLAPGSYPITIVANEHGNVHTAAASIRVSSAVPVAQPPTTRAQAKSVVGTSSIFALVWWLAATEAGSPIAAYELQASVDGGAFTARGTTSGAVRQLAVPQALGHAYSYRVRARDAAGAWSDWATGPTLTAGLVQDRSGVAYGPGTWRRVLYSLASGGSTTYATAAGARARATFTGRGVALVAPIGTTRGSTRIYIDGVYRGTVSLRSPTNKSRVVDYSISFPTVGTHTIELRLRGNGRVDLDAFVILR